MISVYVDTNCINTRQNIDACNELEKLYKDGKILIEKTDTLDTELQESKGYSTGLKKSLNYIESFGTAVLNHSRLNFCIIGDYSDNKRFSKILTILWGKKKRANYSKQQIRDAMHISTAVRYKGNYFLTQENNLLIKSEEIKNKFGITICNPTNCLKEVLKRLKRNS